MARQIIRVKCGVCGHRTLNTYDLESLVGPYDNLAYLTSGELANAKFPNSEPRTSRPHVGKAPAGVLDRRALEDSFQRITFACHRDCGAKPTVRAERLRAALIDAWQNGRKVVWLPTDLKAA